MDDGMKRKVIIGILLAVSWAGYLWLAWFLLFLTQLGIEQNSGLILSWSISILPLITMIAMSYKGITQSRILFILLSLPVAVITFVVYMYVMDIKDSKLWDAGVRAANYLETTNMRTRAYQYQKQDTSNCRPIENSGNIRCP